MNKSNHSKCPFRKIVKKKITVDEILDNVEETIEEFADCLGTNCMAFDKKISSNGIESIKCKRLDK